MKKAVKNKASPTPTARSMTNDKNEAVKKDKSEVARKDNKVATKKDNHEAPKKDKKLVAEPIPVMQKMNAPGAMVGACKSGWPGFAMVCVGGDLESIWVPLGTTIWTGYRRSMWSATASETTHPSAWVNHGR